MLPRSGSAFEVYTVTPSIHPFKHPTMYTQWESRWGRPAGSAVSEGRQHSSSSDASWRASLHPHAILPSVSSLTPTTDVQPQDSKESVAGGPRRGPVWKRRLSRLCCVLHNKLGILELDERLEHRRTSVTNGQCQSVIAPTQHRRAGHGNGGESCGPAPPSDSITRKTYVWQLGKCVSSKEIIKVRDKESKYAFSNYLLITYVK